MKVLFIHPPWVGKAIYPPMGLAYLAAVLDKKGIENEIVDSEVLNLSVSDIQEIVREKNPDVICLTATTPSAEAAFRCARAIKEVTGKPIILGGVHMTSMPEQTLKKKEIDIGVIGEGEDTLPELLDAIENDKNLRNVSGICYRSGGKVIVTKPRGLIEDLDSIPFPARHKLHQEKYVGSTGLPKVGTITTIMTTRGCPYKCTYCSACTIWKGKLRKRSTGNVLDEIEEAVKKYNVKSLMIKDDTFTVDKERAIQICRGIRERKFGIIWSCSSRVDNVTKELVHEMALAGCKFIEFGFESGSERILEIMKKGTTLDQARNAVRWCREEGISIGGFFMIGNPTETEADIDKTVAFAKELNVDSAQWAITTPYPGSEMYESVKDKIGEVTNWEGFLHSNPLYPGEGTPAFLLSDVPPRVLHKYIKDMTRRFTLKPRRIVRNLMKIRTPHEFFRQIKAGFNLMFRS